jgi:TonB-dependent receptor-like protein
MRPVVEQRLAALGALFFSGFASAGGIPGVAREEVVVSAQRAALVGEVRAANQGTVTSLQLEMRPVLRTGELLETVPGLVVTEHSGDGKANRYFLRGFNLDHGTDFATRVDGFSLTLAATTARGARQIRFRNASSRRDLSIASASSIRRTAANRIATARRGSHEARLRFGGPRRLASSEWLVRRRAPTSAIASRTADPRPSPG